MADVIKIYNDDGSVSEYEKLASRWLKFLDKFPVDKGYSVIVDSGELLAKKPAALELYKAALSAGLSPNEVGLPAIGTGMVFEAKLLKDDKVVAIGTALKAISQYKDWEIGETAARQRLAAACGLGGDVFDKDEMGDIEDQGITSVQEETEQQALIEDEPVDEPVVEEKEKAKPRTTVKKQVKKDNDEVSLPPALMRQIEHQATLKSMEIPEVRDLAEAKVVLQALLAA